MFESGKIYKCLNGKSVRMQPHSTYWHGYPTNEMDPAPIPYDAFGQPMTADAWAKDWGIEAVDGKPVEMAKLPLVDGYIPAPSQRQVGGDHYKNMKISPREFIKANNLDWDVGNAIKYLCRYSTKKGREDLEKSIHYIELLIEEKYGGKHGQE